MVGPGSEQLFLLHGRFPPRALRAEGTLKQVAGLIPADQKILLTYGGGSIKRMMTG
jgi:alcohol dehydrogenase YqhD (iron-dependent ADH family)